MDGASALVDAVGDGLTQESMAVAGAGMIR